MNKIKNVIVFSGLSDKKLLSKIKPLSDRIQNIFLSRKSELIYDGIINIPKIYNNIILVFIERIIKGIFYSIKYSFEIYIGVYLFPHGLIAFLLSKMFRKPIIQILPGSDVRYVVEKKRFVHFLKYADIVITRGENTNKELIKLGVNKVKLFSIPNHFVFPNNGKKIQAEEMIFDLLYIGNFVKVKRIDILIQAIAKIKFELPEIKVGLLGDGVLFDEYKILITKYGLEENFIFLGFQKNVNDYILKSKAFIMTSEYEGLPQAMIEAFAQGIPCIMPNISNIPEVAIHNYNSLLVEPLDVEGFADAIYQLMTDDELYKRLKKGAENFRKEHEYEYSIENITNIWNEILIKIETDKRVKKL